MGQIKITVAICTYDRAPLLAKCLAALMPQIRPGFEVLVVDSASTPEHREAVARIVAAYPSIEFWRLEETGVAHARNSMLSHAHGEWFAIIDDDAVPAADWAEVADELAGRLDQRYGIVGGAVHPIIPEDTEPHMGRRWLQLISAVEMQGEYDQTDRPRVVGANMWFRTTRLRDIGGFPESLGRFGHSLLSGEDKLPVHLLLDRGERIWYCGRLQVGHHIHRERLKRAWATRRAYWDGITDRRIQRIMGGHVSFFEFVGMAAKTAALMPLYVIPSVKHEFFLRFWFNLGWMKETLLPFL